MEKENIHTEKIVNLILANKEIRILQVSELECIYSSFFDRESYATILNRLSKNAVRLQIPIGLEDQHEGVVDLLKM